jgi:tetratricopeptide (TPR) repeat protein
MNQGYPLVVIESPKGEVKLTWPGGANVEQLRKLLDEALAPPSPSRAGQLLRTGDAKFGANQIDDAIAAYREALAKGGEGWRRRDHAIEQLVGAQQVKDNAACARSAAEYLPSMPRRHEFVNVALMGVSCDEKLEKFAAEALELPAATEDDRYMLYEALYRSAADKQTLAEKYLAYVQSRPAPANVDQRLARDLALLRAAIKAGVPERAIPRLEATEREVRDDNASQWLATAYNAANRPDDAIAACDRGLERNPGPSGRARLLLSRASAHRKKGDAEAARSDLLAAKAAAQQITTAASREPTLAQIETMLK